MRYENVKLTLNSCYLCTCFWESAKMREFLIFLFTFDNFLETFLTNCFYRTVENFLNNMIIIEKIYVDNECLVIMLNLSAAPSMAQRHYGSRDCRPLRELSLQNLKILGFPEVMHLPKSDPIFCKNPFKRYKKIGYKLSIKLGIKVFFNIFFLMIVFIFNWKKLTNNIKFRSITDLEWKVFV